MIYLSALYFGFTFVFIYFSGQNILMRSSSISGRPVTGHFPFFLYLETNVINLSSHCLPEVFSPDMCHYAGITEHQAWHWGQCVPLTQASPAHGAQVTRHIGGQHRRRRRDGLARVWWRLCVLSVVPPIFKEIQNYVGYFFVLKSQSLPTKKL